MGCMWSGAEFKEEGDDSTAAVASTAAAGLQTRLLLMDNADAHVFIPGFRLPKPATDLTTALQPQQGVNIPSSLVNRLVSLRSRVILAIAAGGSYSMEESASVVSAKLSKRRISQQGSADCSELQKALGDYLPLLLGLTFTEEKVSSAVKFEWSNQEDQKKETALPSALYELLSVLHLLGILALQEANNCLTVKATADGYLPRVTEENKKNAVEILLKAAQFFECALSSVLPQLPDDIKAKLPVDLSEDVLIALEQQALGQGVEIQLGLAIENVKASVAVKRRLACEQVKYWLQAYDCASRVSLEHGWGPKHKLFVKWKLAEAQAAAYYYHGLILDENPGDASHVQALACLQGAQAFLKEGQRTRTKFVNTAPITRVPPSWGAMKYLSEKIPRDTTKKTRASGGNITQHKTPIATPQLPDFPLALKAEAFILPHVDRAWEAVSCYQPNHAPIEKGPTSHMKKLQDVQSLPGFDLRRQPTLTIPKYVRAR
ncbi:unnamed protein product [Sphagnum jensenii]|uniref:BRO1 domain-containing protein n=1 Tax=Sphagnum jensenii TaxID=128206 RepID=A0ABP1AIL3_9BRYO